MRPASQTSASGDAPCASRLVGRAAWALLLVLVTACGVPLEDAAPTTRPPLSGPSPAPAPSTAGPLPPTHTSTACTPAQRVLFGHVDNARDLGGLPFTRPDARGALACGQLYRGAHWGSLTEFGCDDVATLGIRTLVDLREPSEQRTRPDVACPGGPVRVDAPLPIPYELSPQNYLADLDTDASVRAVFEALGDAASYPVFVHCTYGRDRTGVIMALVLLALGVPEDAILADYTRTADAGLFIRPESLRAVLEEVARRGGIEAHLASIGVGPEELAVLRAQLTAPPR
jgi:protein tyrosine phosphatase (PTP) superfamily phosphohydrolase (DUF442 family)